MEERLRICLWMVGGGVLGGLLGSAFGGFTGAFNALDGRAAGTRLARRVANTFLDAAERPSSHVRRAALVGALDGLIFLGVVGLVCGILVGMSDRAAHELLVPVVLGSTLLVVAAAGFGTLAFAMSHGPRTFGSVISGGLLGAFVAAWMLGVDHLLLGVVPGFLVGLLVARAASRYAPKFHPPQIGKTARSPRSDGKSDVTPPHARPDGDFFSRPDSFEEG